MTTIAQTNKKYNEKIEMIEALKGLGFNGTYAGNKGHGFWLVYQEYALGYKSIAELKKLIEKNNIGSLTSNLEQYPRTDKFIYGFCLGRDF